MKPRPLSYQEENYLKAVLKISEGRGKKDAGILELSRALGVKPPTAHQMLKKLKEKKLVLFEKYGKVMLSAGGRKAAMALVRKHRIWETFLHDVLKFSWDEVHELAEYLEHIPSDEIINRLEKLLGNPKFDPHGDPIPDVGGNVRPAFRKTLSMGTPGRNYHLVAVSDSHQSLLQFMSKYNLKINDKIKYVSELGLDGMGVIRVRNKNITVGSTFMHEVKVVCEQCMKKCKCPDEVWCVV
ncbi:MAG: metal-dependent transcriptional regulator [Bacteroidia bacterium]|nr:metal-dependent transcriptional regulator [Bacteroidia bacterium]